MRDTCRKILFLTPVYNGFGGAEMLMIRIANSYRLQGIDVKIIIEHSDYLEDFEKRCQSCGLEFQYEKIADAGYTGVNFFKQLFLKTLRVVSLIKREKPDVVEIMLPSSFQGLALLIACSICRMPTNVNFALVGENDPDYISFRRSLVYRLAKRSFQAWTSFSENNARILEKTFGLKKGDVEVIHNGAPTRTKYEPKDRREVRKNIGIDDSRIILITTARLAEQKGHKWLIEIMPKLVKKYPDILFLWVGDGELEQELRARVEEAGMNEYVLMTGFRTDVMDLLNAADLFVFPTEFEGCPASLHEAIFAACPVVASDASGIPEVIEHKKHGLLFESKNPSDMFDKLDQALSDMGRMREYAEAARSELCEKFSEDVMFKAHLELLCKLKNRVR